MIPFMKLAYLFKKDAMCPEVKVNRETFPDHLYQWLYDEDNPL